MFSAKLMQPSYDVSLCVKIRRPMIVLMNVDIDPGYPRDHPYPFIYLEHLVFCVDAP